jgi:exosortase/archaeosortase family protein
VAAVALAACLLWVFRGTLARYLADQHYQEHFLYLWVFLALALWRSVRRPFRTHASLRSLRDLAGLGLAASSWMLLLTHELGGSNIVGRTALVAFVTALAVLSLPAWSVGRCLAHGVLLQLCFGLPYSVYFPLTERMQWGVAQMVALPAKLGLASYEVVDAVAVFPHYQLRITADCSGMGQVLTFVGMAALGVLGAAPDPRRAVRLFALAIALAWLSNLARVGLFVLLVGWGATWAVDDAGWHAALGTVVFLPFAVALVAAILRSFRPWSPAAAATPAAGRLPIALLVVPLFAVHAALGDRSSEPAARPGYFAELEHPPGHALALRGPTEAADRAAYETPWLLNARFIAADGGTFDLFHYTTRSRSHLCVHRIADCVDGPGLSIRYAEPVVVDGRPWWRLAVEADAPDRATRHVYFAFEVDGMRCDDSWTTQWHVLRARVTGASWDVACTRVMFDGPLTAVPTGREVAVLAWLGRLVSGPSAR